MRSTRRYLPGPHCGSASGKKKENAPTTVVESIREPPSAIAFERPFVLSINVCTGKPVGVGDCVWLRVVDPVDVPDEACDAVDVSVLDWLAVTVELGDNVGVGVNVCVGLGLEERVTAADIVDVSVGDALWVALRVNV